MAEAVAAKLEHDGFVFEEGQKFDVGNGGRVVLNRINSNGTFEVDYVIPMIVTPSYLAGRGKLVT